KLNPMEVRFGTSDGVFLTFIKELIETYQNTLELLCPISQSRIKNREYEEMLLRFFAYRFDMDSYKKEVHLFLNDFMAKMNGEYKYKNDETHISFDKVLFTQTFDDMLKFIKNNFGPLYFKRTETQKSVPRIRFEALAVG